MEGLIMGYYEQDACRGPVHASVETKGLFCDGQGCFEVMESGKRVKKVKYWCSAAHQHFDPWDESWKCPRFEGTGGGEF